MEVKMNGACLPLNRCCSKVLEGIGFDYLADPKLTMVPPSTSHREHRSLAR